MVDYRFVAAADVAAFLGKPGDAATVALAEQHVPLVESVVREYTRGRGFDGSDLMVESIAQVVIAATARLTQNPELTVSETIGDYSVRRTVFEGLSLMERMVLNGYRRRTA